jgi:hypothetical protein
MDPHIQPNHNPRDPRIQPPPVPLEYQVTPGAAPAGPPALPAARFPSVPYAPDGAGPVGGFFALLGLTLLAGAVIGAIAGMIHLVFYLVLIFPIIMGFALGGAALGAVVLGKVRNRLVAALAGLLGGCVCIIAMHFIGYLFVLSKSPEPFSFGQYIHAAATSGVTISSSRSSSSKPMNLGYVGSFIYWFLELAIVAGIAAGVPVVRAGQPFCEECDSWKTQHKLGVLFLRGDTALEHLQSGELWRLADPHEAPGEGPITLTVWWCPHCLEAAPVDARLDQAVQKKKSVRQVLLGFRTFPGEALPVFRGLCLRRADPNIPPAVG